MSEAIKPEVTGIKNSGRESVGRRLIQEPDNWLDLASNWIADRCSPILVKETRQALKSRQFQWTFLLLLLSVVIWSFLGVSYSIRDQVEENGPSMMIGYLVILAFPLCVVIPLAAFRSLAREFEDETIQLVSITTMSARRIILGKLGSALLHIVLYMAAVTPCIVFSYILRGISFSMIWVGFSISFVGSVGLTCVSLMVAGSCRNPFLRVAANLFLLLGLLGAFSFWCMFLTEVLWRWGQGDETLIIANMTSMVFAAIAYASIEATSSLISFTAENRSTRLRIALLALPAVFYAAVLASGTSFDGQLPIEVTTFGLSIVGSHYVVIVGVMMSSERSGLSNRVRRELPRTFLGRALFGLFYPGPGRGYLFSIALLISINLVAVLTYMWQDFMSAVFFTQASRSNLESLLLVATFNGIFGTIYLSFVYLVMLLLERYAGTLKVLVGLLLGVIAYVLVAVLSFTAHEFLFATVRNYGGNNYDLSIAYYINWPAMLEYSSRSSPLYDHLILAAVLMGIVAIVLAMFAFRVALRELAVSAASLPARVMEEMQKRQTPKLPKGETFNEIFEGRSGS